MVRNNPILKLVLATVFLLGAFTLNAQHRVRWRVNWATDLELTPIAGYKTISNANFLQKNYSGQSVELGTGILYGEMEDNFIAGSWYYTSFDATVEHTFSNYVDNRSATTLNLGFSGGTGIHFLILNAGIHGAVNYSTDFENHYIRYKVGIGGKRITYSIGNYVHLDRQSAINSGVNFTGFASIDLRIWGKGEY